MFFMTKKVIAICAMLLVAIMLASCSGNGNNATPDEATADEPTTAQKVVKIETPYGNLSVSEEFDKAMDHVVREEDPYILDFVSKDDKTTVLSIHFNDKTKDVLGTLKTDGKDVVLYAEFPAIDKKSSHYTEYTNYQMEVNTIVNHLEQDYGFTAGYDPGTVESETNESNETFDIKTTLVTLKYPKKWEDKVTVTEKDNVVSFAAGKTPLFDLYYKECDGVLLGTYNKTPIYIKEHKVKEAEHTAMINDVNVIIRHLNDDKNFTMA